MTGIGDSTLTRRPVAKNESNPYQHTYDFIDEMEAFHADLVSYIEAQECISKGVNENPEPDSVFVFEDAIDIDDSDFLESWAKMESRGKANDCDSWVNLLKRFNLLEIFKDKEPWPKKGQSSSSQNHHPLALNRLNGFMRNFRLIRRKHPDARMIAAICRDTKYGDIIHFVVFYRKSKSNVAIVVPVTSKCYSACYVWVNKQPEFTPADWEIVFHYDPSHPNAVISKHHIWLRKDTRRFYHKAAQKTKGLDEVNNMWSNVLTHINQVA